MLRALCFRHSYWHLNKMEEQEVREVYVICRTCDYEKPLSDTQVHLCYRICRACKGSISRLPFDDAPRPHGLSTVGSGTFNARPLDEETIPEPTSVEVHRDDSVWKRLRSRFARRSSGKGQTGDTECGHCGYPKLPAEECPRLAHHRPERKEG